VKRFIDLRGQGAGYSFAWWDTVTDSFEIHNGDSAWDTFSQFEAAYEGNEPLDRYRKLCPAWALTAGEDAS